MTLLLRARHAFLDALPAHLQASAAIRYDTEAGLLLDRLHRLYGSADQFETWCCELLASAGRFHAVRPEPLQQLDRQRERTPDWFLDPRMLGYSAYVDRFAGTLRGVIDRVPYLRELGVTYLHLLPFLKMRAGDNDGGFAVAGFDVVEPALGTLADLETLTRELRAAGISLCADFVLNHVADDHPWALAAAGGDAHFRSFFHIFPDRSLPDAYEAQVADVFPGVAPGSFTWVPALEGWVWTTFYPYQWDLDYSNPAVFAAIVRALLNLANRGIEIFRLDSAPYLWKRAGSDCRNQPEVHWLLQVLRSLIRLAAPGVLLKAEAIEPLHKLPEYFGSAEARGRECHLAYHSTLMAAAWAALVEQRTELLRTAIGATPALPGPACWMTYVRCHDDIVWSTLRAVSDGDGAQLDRRIAPVSRFLAGETDGSFARGAAFQAGGGRAVFGTNGMTAALVGFESAANDAEREMAERRLRLLYGLAFSFGGLPLIYMGDEIALGNGCAGDAAGAADGRWLQRPVLDDALLGARHDTRSVAGRTYAALGELIRCRQRLPALNAGVPRRLVAVDDPALLILWRGTDFVALANFANAEKRISTAILFTDGAADGWFESFTGQPVGECLVLMACGLLWLERRP